MTDSSFFARVRTDARRNLPRLGYEASSHKEHTVFSPQTTSTQARRNEGPIDGDGLTAMKASPGSESPLRFERIMPRTADHRIEKMDVPPYGESAEVGKTVDVRNTGSDRDTVSVRSNGKATQREQSDTTRPPVATIEYETTQTRQRFQNNTFTDETGDRSTNVFDEHDPNTPAPGEQQPTSEQDQYVEHDAVDSSNEHEARQPGRATEADESIASPDTSKDLAPRPTDTHQYTLGRERPESPTHSSASHPGQREVKPPRLHIGEVVIRVEEDPKPQRAKRRGRSSTLSDSQRLIRSL